MHLYSWICCYFFDPKSPVHCSWGTKKIEKHAASNSSEKKCFPLLGAIARGMHKKIKGSTAISRWHTCRADFSRQKWLVCGWCYTLHPDASKMLLCPKRMFLCILPSAHSTVRFFSRNFGRFRDFSRPNVWRLQ